MASVKSGSEARDQHIKSVKLLDVEQLPTIRSTSMAWRGSRGNVHGDLTIHGVTHPVDLDLTRACRLRRRPPAASTKAGARDRPNTTGYLPRWKVTDILSIMESNSAEQNPGDRRSELAVADQARQRLAAGLRLPTGLHPILAAAVAVQVGAAAYGIAAQTTAGLAVALAGIAVLMGVAALLLHQFRRINGVRVNGLSSQIVLGTGGTSTLTYLVGFGAATWAAFESHWWLVTAAAATAGVSYAFGTFRWWHVYRDDPSAHAGGAPPRVFVGVAVLACLGLVALLIAG
jgi:hypothetical protein